MRIQRWHWGKLAILWAWGGLIAALLLTQFLRAPADASPATSSLAFIGSVTLLMALTVVTWIWLGGKDRVG